MSKGLRRVEQLLSRVRGTCPKFSGCAIARGRAGIGVNGVCSEDRSLQVLPQGPSITGFSPSSGMPKGAGSVLGQHLSKVTMSDSTAPPHRTLRRRTTPSRPMCPTAQRHHLRNVVYKTGGAGRTHRVECMQPQRKSPVTKFSEGKRIFLEVAATISRAAPTYSHLLLSPSTFYWERSRKRF